MFLYPCLHDRVAGREHKLREQEFLQFPWEDSSGDESGNQAPSPEDLPSAEIVLNKP